MRIRRSLFPNFSPLKASREKLYDHVFGNGGRSLPFGLEISMLAKNKILKISSILAILILVGWIFSDDLLQSAGNFLVVSNRPEEAELVVVLGGDFWGPRVKLAAEIAKAGFAPKALISGPVYMQDKKPVPEGVLAINMLTADGYSAELLESFLIRSVSTIEEIEEISAELKRRKIKNIILVTSDYHSRRACLAFFLAAPKINTQCIGAPDPQFNVQRWWTDPAQSNRVRKEWTKLIGTVVLRSPFFFFRLLD